MRSAMAVLMVCAGLLVVAAVYRPGLRPATEAGSMSVMVSRPAEQSRILAGRMWAKSDVARRLLAGELTLFQAAAIFRVLNAHPPGREDRSWQQFPGVCDGERLCRQVISWAGGALGEKYPPHLAAARVVALEQQLLDHVRAHGQVQLIDSE